MAEDAVHSYAYSTVRKKKRKGLLTLRKFAGDTMEIIKANSGNLASVLMGKNIQFPWRGQSDVVISVPYEEWVKFIQNFDGYLRYRGPLNYKQAVVEKGTDLSVRYFLYDISWAQYSELACSSNVQEDATLILPYFEDGKYIQIEDALSDLDKLELPEVTKYHNRLRAVTRNYYNLIGATDISFGLVDLSRLSTWNSFIFKMCLYLQSKSSNTVKTERLNVDWRSI